MGDLKYCSGCEKERPISTFYKNAGKKDGRRDQCKNCYKEKNNAAHRSRTAQRRVDSKKWFCEEVLSKSKCIECGENHPATIDFHHRDPMTKVDEISQMVSGLVNIEKIKLELTKCDTLCANCHRKRHWQESVRKDYF